MRIVIVKWKSEEEIENSISLKDDDDNKYVGNAIKMLQDFCVVRNHRCNMAKKVRPTLCAYLTMY